MPRTAPRIPKRKPAAKRAAMSIPDQPTASVLEENPPTMPTEVPETPSDPVMDTPKRAAKPRAGSLEARLNEAFASISIVPAFAGDQYSAFILASRSPAFCHNLAELAKVNPRVKKTLEGMLNGGQYGGVMFSAAALALPILWAYGILPQPPVDPFSIFYPAVPDSAVPRSALKRDVRSSAKNPAGQSGSSGGMRVPPEQRSGPPEGVVTVRPNAVPPMNPAATQ